MAVPRCFASFCNDLLSVIEALSQAGGNKAKAARLLGIDYKSYRTKLKIAVGGQQAPANGGN